jgi:hypothetical protein
MLRKIIILSAFFLSVASIHVFAQGADAASPYVFPEFVQSTVLQKNGGRVNALLNYNTITQEMMFEQNGSRIVMDQGSTDTIYLQNRKFIPAKGVYLEKVTNTRAALYVQNKNKAVLAQKGEKVNGVLSDVYKKNETEKADPYALKLPDSYRLLNDNKYWLQQGSDLIALTNLKKIPSLFPKKEAEVAKFIEENKISLTSQEDMVRLVEFGNGL